MQLGLIGLGRMGGNMRDRVRAAGHEVVGYDPRPEVTDVESLQALADALDGAAGRVGDGPVRRPDPRDRPQAGRRALARRPRDRRRQLPLHRRRPERRAARREGIGFVDCGVSGGIWGKENGYGLMAGGADEHIEHAMPIFDALRPEGPREEGFAHAGPVGAGHFAKMVHNGIEYGLMQAYAEGYELMAATELITNVTGMLQAWSRGTVVRSWLLDLLVLALKDDPGLEAQRLRRRLRRGPLDDRGGHPARRAAAGDLGGAVRPVHLAAGVVAGDEGGRRAAPPVRRARGQAVGPSGTPGQLAGPSSGTGATPQPGGDARVHLRRLAVVDFRSWERAELDLEPGVTVLVGPNGVGKTNLVEAVGYLATLGRTGCPATRPWCAAAPSGRWSAGRWCTRAAS